MPLAVMRLNYIQPGIEPKEMSARYRAGLEMAKWADDHGFLAVTQEEHHGVPNGWSPAPLVGASAILSRTSNVMVSISALLVPLHDPLRLAEDIAVLDLMAPGRISVIGGLGYRPEEYAQHGKDWSRRGKLMDESVGAILAAWTGEPFEYQGRTVQVTPKPVSAHPPLMIGGTSRAAARRAARFGLPLSMAATVPDVEAYYYELCAAEGKQGMVLSPPPNFAHHWIAEDPDRAWAEIGQYLFHETSLYASWQTPDVTSAVSSKATTVEELRAEGIYKILTPDEAVAAATAGGPGFAFSLHPLCGGMPIERGWEGLELYANKVLPRLS